MTRNSLRVAIVSVACAILLGACSLTPGGADQTNPTTSLGSCPAASSRDLARQQVDYRDGGAEPLAALLGTRLADTTGAAPPAIHAFDPCLVIASIPGGGDDVLSVRPRFADQPNYSRGFYGPTLVVYRYAG